MQSQNKNNKTIEMIEAPGYQRSAIAGVLKLTSDFYVCVIRFVQTANNGLDLYLWNLVQPKELHHLCFLQIHIRGCMVPMATLDTLE